MIDEKDPFDDAAEEVAPAPVKKDTPKGAAVVAAKDGKDEARLLEAPIRLLSLDIVGFKRIQAVQLELKKSGLTVLGGLNRQGKSSTLDAVKILLSGKKYTPESPVHNDDPQATIMGTIEDVAGHAYHIKRVIKPDRSDAVSLSRADGSPVGKPQEFLDSLTGKVWCKPLQFLDQSEPEKAETIRQWVGLDLSDLISAEEALYNEREVLGRDVRRVKGHAESLEYFPDAPDVEQSASDVVAQFSVVTRLKKMRDYIANLKAEPAAIKATAAAETTRLTTECASIEKQIADLQASLKAKKAELTAIDGKCKQDCKDADAKVAEYEKKLADYIKENGDPDEADVSRRMDENEELNRKARANADRKKAFTEYESLQAEYDGYTEKIESIRATKRRRIAGVKMPVDGLKFDDDGLNLQYNDLPLKNASGAEQVRIAVTIAMRLSGGLRVCLVDQGEALDPTQLALLNSIVQELDGQVLLTRVCASDSKDVDLIIEDGMVLDPGKKVAK